MLQPLGHATSFVHLTPELLTSSRRFEANLERQFAKWVALQLLYWLGVPPKWLD